MSKRLKKELQIMIDKKTGQLYFGDKKKDYWQSGICLDRNHFDQNG